MPGGEDKKVEQPLKRATSRYVKGTGTGGGVASNGGTRKSASLSKVRAQTPSTTNVPITFLNVLVPSAPPTMLCHEAF